MIAVIADDFTGAAEIAGIGLRYDLKVEVSMSVTTDSHADLLVVCTDSRSLSKADALKITAGVTKEIVKLMPELVFKKIDSVFRGYVLEEVKVQMQESGLTKALIVGGNPSLGRTIKEGHYFIHDKLITETGFVHDPEFAIKDSSVLKMLKTDANEVRVVRHLDELPGKGIVAGEAHSREDMLLWADKIDNKWVLAGAADFFIALLDKKYVERLYPPVEIKEPHLYVSGTAFDKSKKFIKEIAAKQNCVAYLPERMIQVNSEINPEWLESADTILKSQGRLIIAIDEVAGVPALSLRTIMAKAVKRMIENGEVKEIFIEGGSTAAAILTELDITTLYPVNELSRGVVRMKAKELHITVKPGSYELPKQIKQLYLN